MGSQRTVNHEQWALRYERLATRLALAGDRIRSRALHLKARADRLLQEAQGFPPDSEERLLCEWRARQLVQAAADFASYADWHVARVEALWRRAAQERDEEGSATSGADGFGLSHTPEEITTIIRAETTWLDAPASAASPS